MGERIRLNMELMSALTIIFETKIEFTPDCFAPLRGEKREAYLRKVGPMTQPMYEVVVLEPTVIDRVSHEKFTIELNIVDGPQRKQLLDAVKFVYDSRDAWKTARDCIRGSSRMGAIKISRSDYRDQSR